MSHKNGILQQFKYLRGYLLKQGCITHQFFTYSRQGLYIPGDGNLGVYKGFIQLQFPYRHAAQ